MQSWINSILIGQRQVSYTFKNPLKNNQKIYRKPNLKEEKSRNKLIGLNIFGVLQYFFVEIGIKIFFDLK